MASKYRSLFSPSDLYHLADQIVDKRDRLDMIYKLALAEGDKERARIYYDLIIELDMLITGYGMREMIKFE